MAPLMDQIMLFGDSITEFAEVPEGFSAVLRQAYIRRLDVVNRGLSGYNTDMALRVLDKIIPATQNNDGIRLMTIFFGANDSCMRTEHNNQAVPLPEFRSNLIKIIQTISARKSPRFILITNPPVDERTQQMLDISKGRSSDLRRTAEQTKLYADAIRDVGVNLGIPVVDLWADIMSKAGWQSDSDGLLPGCTKLPPNPVLAELLSDGLHLSGSGYRLLTDSLMKCIADHYPDQQPDNLPFVLPRWDDGDAWKARGETDALVNYRPRVIIPPNNEPESLSS